MHKLLLAAVLAVLTTASLSPASAADRSNRWEGLRLNASWINPGASAKYEVDTSPVTAGKMTGSLVGVGVGYDFQFGRFVVGFDANFYGGIIEAQENLRFISVKGLALGTASLGYAISDKLLVRAGGGPAFALAHVGKMDTGLRYDTLSGVHAVVGVEYALTRHTAVGFRAHRLRLADSSYSTPAGIEGVNFKDSWMGELSLSYRF